MSHSPVLRAAHVGRPPQEAFALFTERIGAWWPLPTHGLFGGDSGGVAFVGGRLVERSVTGEETVWGEVLAWEPPTRLVVSWHPGRPDAPTGTSTEVEVRFLATEGGTRVELEHRGWEVLADRADAARRQYIGPNAWGHVLDHFADVADRAAGSAVTADLRSGYDAFFTEASSGGFAEPAQPAERDGAVGWSPAQVVAHVAVNDDLLSAVCRALIHQEAQPRLDNAISNDVTVLDRFVAAHGPDLPTLVAAGRARAAQVVTLLERLDDDQLARLVHCHLASDGGVLVDDDRPWSTMQQIHATFHLPSHTEQLHALRPPVGDARR